MTTSIDFTLFSAQVSVFFAEGSSFSQSKFLASILSNYADLYNGPVETLPGVFVLEAPPEIPRVTLQSADGQWRLQGGPMRVDAFWNTSDIYSNPDDVIRKCVDSITQYFKSDPSMQVSRLAMILTHIKIIENPARFLLDRLVNDDSKNNLFTDTERFEIHHYRKDRLPSNDVIVNKWTRYKSDDIQPINEPIISIEQDINTIEADGRIFSVGMINTYYDEAQTYASVFLDRVFSQGR